MEIINLFKLEETKIQHVWIEDQLRSQKIKPVLYDQQVIDDKDLHFKFHFYNIESSASFLEVRKHICDRYLDLIKIKNRASATLRTDGENLILNIDQRIPINAYLTTISCYFLNVFFAEVDPQAINLKGEFNKFYAIEVVNAQRSNVDNFVDDERLYPRI